MDATRETIELQRFQTSPCSCSYLPDQTAQLDYRILLEISPQAYSELLCRGWRRFGREFFRPVCKHCQQCRGLRVLVNEFEPSRSQRRTLERNNHIRVVVQSPRITPDHLQLYNAYHADMHFRRGWEPQEVSVDDYRQSFLAGNGGFAREFLYWQDDRLVGVALADLLPAALSSVYFFHDPEMRPQALGVFSILKQIQFCQQQGLRYQYLGYWIADCQSMAYKANYRPHEILTRFPADHESPVWLRPSP